MKQRKRESVNQVSGEAKLLSSYEIVVEKSPQRQLEGNKTMECSHNKCWTRQLHRPAHGINTGIKKPITEAIPAIYRYQPGRDLR
jgi:hypothetical protein